MSNHLLFSFRVHTIDFRTTEPLRDDTIFPAPAVEYRGRRMPVCYGCNRLLRDVASPCQFKTFTYKSRQYRINIHICERCDIYVYVPLAIIEENGERVPFKTISDEQHDLYMDGR